MSNVDKQVEKEVFFGTWPVLKKERKYGFIDALLVLSGYCIATWSYTQGSYLATLVGFKQLLIGAFLAALFMLLVYQLPVTVRGFHGKSPRIIRNSFISGRTPDTEPVVCGPWNSYRI